MIYRKTRRAVLLLLTLTLMLPAAAVSAPSGHALPVEIVARDPFEWNRALTVLAAETIKRHRQKQGLILVDVRTAADWSIAHIPGAMHIPLAFLEAKAFLKGRPMVLIGSGHDSVALLAACRDIDAKGFKARVLAGGIQAWLAADGPLTGNPAGLIPQREMRPEAFYREKNITNRPVLFVAASDAQAEMDAVIPYALRISPDARPEDIKKQFDAAFKGDWSGENHPLLVCTPDGRDHDRIAARLAQAGLTPALFLEGGLTAYRNYCTGILQVPRPREDRMKTVGGCQGCGPVETPAEYETEH